MGKQARVSAALKAVEVERDAAKPKVAVAYVHDNAGRVTSFEESLLALRDFDSDNMGLIADRITMRFGTDGLTAARNTIAVQFLAGECDWLLMVDTDMGFEPDSLYRLLQVAHPVDRPIVGGLCFVNREFAHDGMWGYRAKPVPTIYDWREDPSSGVTGFLASPMYAVNAVVRCAATGAAFLLVHRSVFERIAETLIPGTEENIGPHWFDRSHGPDGKLMGEDISFCVRAALAEIPVHVHTGVRTTHFKEFWLGEPDHWRQYIAPPAAERVAVLVPVLRRPQNAEPFMRSLRASTGLATVYAIADDDDPETAEAWRAAGAEVIVDNRRTFARKVNLGFSKTAEPWVFLVGDDVKFHPGWLDQALHVAQVLEASVVGTNDLGNPRVMRGEHATHMLIRRSYVDEVGASWDGPGVVAHEGFRHWGVDDVIVTAAKQRGVWQMALGSVVEHNHPYWSKAEPDEVYELGESHAEEDMALLRSLLAEHGVQR